MATVAKTSSTLSSITLAYAFIVAVAGDLLIGDAPRGIAFFVWVVLLTGMAWTLMRRAEIAISRETVFWLISAMVFAAGIAWRDAIVLQLFNFMATFFSLAMVVASCRRSVSLLFSSNIEQLIRAFVSVCASMVTGVFSLASDVGKSRAQDSKGNLTRILRAGSVALIPSFMCLALLRSADPVFASLATLPACDFSEMIRNIALTIVLFVGLGGAAHAALTPKSTIDDAKGALPRFQLNRLEIVFLLGALNILFTAFVLAQLGWLFGGEQFLQARTGLSVAEYARHGFFQMVVVVLLVIPVLLISRSFIVSSPALARLHTWLAIPIIILLSLMILSSAMKVQLYVSHFGLSTDRLYTLLFLIWLGVVLIWLALTILRDQSIRFPSGVVISAFTALLLLNIFVPDRIVAKVNIARAHNLPQSATPLDIDYLINLSADAVDISIQAVLAMSPTTPKQQQDRCAAATTLLSRWGTEIAQRNSWRFFNASDAKARRLVHTYSDALNATCALHSQPLLPD